MSVTLRRDQSRPLRSLDGCRQPDGPRIVSQTMMLVGAGHHQQPSATQTRIPQPFSGNPKFKSRTMT